MISRLTTVTKVILFPVILFLYLIGYEIYVGEDSFKEYWDSFGNRYEA